MNEYTLTYSVVLFGESTNQHRYELTLTHIRPVTGKSTPVLV